jgi:putative inorganic carbon (hco3(-)) transporter
MKKSIKDYILYSLIMYAFVSAMGITPAEVFLIIGLILWIADVWINRPSLKQQFSSPVTLPLAFFLLIHFIAAVFGIDILNSLKNFKQVYIILMFFLAANYAGGKKDISRAVNAFIAGAAVVGLWCIAMTIKNRYIGHDPDFRASSFSGNHMHAGGMLMMAVIVSASALLRDKKDGSGIKPVLFHSFAFLLTAAGLLFTYTRGSWLGAGIGVFMAAVYYDKKIAAAAVIAALAFVLMFGHTSFAGRAISSFKAEPGTSAAERVSMWKSGLRIIRDHPALGIGTANLEKIYPKYRQPEAREPNAGHLHNNLIQIAVIDGLPGLGAFLWLFAAFWISMIRDLMKNKDGNRVFLLYTALCVNIAFFVNGFFEYNFFSTQPVLMFWFLMGLGFAGMKSRVQSGNSEPG